MIKKSVDALKKHFTIAKEDNDETKSQKQIDRARINLGIA
jgi:hypothetical protein